MWGAVLNYVQRIMLKATSSNYDQDKHSVEAIGNDVDTIITNVGTAITDIAALNDVSEAQVNAQVDGALNTEIPSSNVADSVNDVLLDQIKPRLPGSGIIQTAAFRKNVSVELIFPIYDADGDLVGSAAGLDSEVSKDGASFNDCTNEASEIGNGVYKLTLTAAEMNADRVAIVTKSSTSGSKDTLTVIYTSA